MILVRDFLTSEENITVVSISQKFVLDLTSALTSRKNRDGIIDEVLSMKVFKVNRTDSGITLYVECEDDHSKKADITTTEN